MFCLTRGKKDAYPVDVRDEDLVEVAVRHAACHVTLDGGDVSAA